MKTTIGGHAIGPDTIQLAQLKCEDDWRKCRKAIEKLEASSQPNPWASWLHSHNTWNIAFQDHPAWLLTVHAEGRTIAAAFFREELSNRRSGTCKILRSFDWGAGAMPPFIFAKGHEEQACRLFSASVSHIRKITGASFIHWRFIDEEDGRFLIENLKTNESIFKTTRSTNDQVIESEKWTTRKSRKKQMQNLRRNERRLRETFDIEPSFVRFRGNVLGELASNGLWVQQKELWQASWQKEQLGATGALQTERYFDLCVTEWSRKGWLDFSALLLGDRLVALYLNLAVEDRVWLLRTLFDGQYSDFGVGTINLLKMADDGMERGDRLMSFGGEAVQWKRRYSTSERPMLEIELGLGGIRSRLWKVAGWLKEQSGRLEHISPDRIESRGDFILAKLGVKARNEQSDTVSVCPLDSEQDWQAIRRELEALQIKCEISPWFQWECLHTTWKRFYPGRRVWLVRLPLPTGKGKGLLGAGLWLEETEKRKGLSLKMLRSLDAMSIRVPPFMMRKGMETEACRAMAEALTQISKTTGCDLIASYRQDGRLGEIWMDQLKLAGADFQKRIFTNSSIARFPDGFDSYFAGLSKRIRETVRRSGNKLKRDFGDEYERIHLHGKVTEDPRFDELWSQFETLRENSWQYDEARKTGNVDTGALTEFYREAAKIWSRQRILDFNMLRVNGMAMAASLGVSVGGRHYGLLYAYDRKYKRYSPGTLLYVTELEQAEHRGEKCVDMGGEGSDWKKEWAPIEEPIYQIEIPLYGWKALLWRISRRFSRSASDDPLR